MRPTLPTVDEVRALPRLLHRTVPPEWEDLNGHMNISRYVALHDEASWGWMASLGMSEATFTQDMRGLFDLEHHLHYLAEVRVGDEVAIHARMVARGDTRMHGVFFLVDETTDRLANTFEWVTIAMDLGARRPAPWPAEVAARIDDLVREHDQLPWPAPTCGVMGV